jgi:hypothetical protein
MQKGKLEQGKVIQREREDEGRKREIKNFYYAIKP